MKSQTNQLFKRTLSIEYDSISKMDKWTKRNAVIADSSGNIIESYKNILTPASWSDTACQIAFSKYATLGTDTDIQGIIKRVAGFIANAGLKQGYFKTEEEAEDFRLEYGYLLTKQYLAPNTPVWINAGIQESPQNSACFIMPIDDNMESIMEMARASAMLFKYGSGVGASLSNIRSSYERVTGGGVASGPCSFGRIYDIIGGVIKSGGKSRRAALLLSMDVGHPDIEQFIQCKKVEEDKARALIREGYSSNAFKPGNAYESVGWQNVNISIAITDEFMKAVEADEDWNLIAKTTGKTQRKVKARKILEEIADSCWDCGDPGAQYIDTMNKWNTVSSSASIRCTNPCGEFSAPDGTSCNLASINLMKLRKDNGSFDSEKFAHIVNMSIIAQEILVDASSYPTKLIEKNTKRFRALGLGWTNGATLLMSLGLPYDSDEGRSLLAAITSYMTATAYQTSIKLAERIGKPFQAYSNNKRNIANIIEMHTIATLNPASCGCIMSERSMDIWAKSGLLWQDLHEKAEEKDFIGFRNSQVTLLAPTGTISLVMDCESTGIEPMFMLKTIKKTTTGETLTVMPLKALVLGLEAHNVSKESIDKIVKAIEEDRPIEEIDTVANNGNIMKMLQVAMGNNMVSHKGHLRMMGAIQPFISGSISKTVNVRKDTTKEEIYSIFVEAWKMGLKAIAIYRDESKGSQPLSGNTKAKNGKPIRELPAIMRMKLPDNRPGMIHRFVIHDDMGPVKGFINPGYDPELYPNETVLREIFIRVGRVGSLANGLLDVLGEITSKGLQYGMPLDEIIQTFQSHSFSPSGRVDDPEIRECSSIMDYIGKFLQIRYGDKEEHQLRQANKDMLKEKNEPIKMDTKICPECKHVMYRAGSCFTCMNCGGTSGCS